MGGETNVSSVDDAEFHRTPDAKQAAVRDGCVLRSIHFWTGARAEEGEPRGKGVELGEVEEDRLVRGASGR